jgi:putative ABC transport system permease protein
VDAVRQALALAVRGLGARAGTSAVVAAVGLFATAAAATGPLYLAAAGESVLQDALRGAPVASTGVEVRQDAPVGRLVEREVVGAVERALARTGAAPAYRRRTVALEADGSVLVDGVAVARSRLVARDGACGRVAVERGRCPGAGEVLVSVEGAGVLGVDVGDRVALSGTGGLPLVVAGLYVPLDVDDPAWHGRDYFVAGRPPSDGTAVDALLTDRGTFAALPADVRARLVVDLALDARAVRWRTADRLRDVVPAVRDEVRAVLGPASGAGSERVVVDGYAAAVLDAADRDRDALALPVLLVLAQLLLLAWLVLHAVVSGAASARAGEVALVRLRGTGSLGTVVFALLETLLLLAAAVPLGVLVAWAGVRGLAVTALADGVPVPLTVAAVGAAAAALGGGAVAAAVASARVLRTPLPDLLRRGTSERAGRRTALGEAGLAAAAAAAAVALLRTAAPQEAAGEPAGGRAVLALAVPGLLAAATALLGARLLPAACRAAGGRVRSTAGWLVVRQVARRQAGLRVVLVLGSAVGLATFSVLAWSVFEGNRTDRALAETGAARVLLVRTPPGTDLRAAVATADPGGRAATAVQTAEATGGGPRLVGADLDRYAGVGFWRADLSPGGLPAVLAALRPPAPEPVLVDDLEVVVTARSASGAAVLHADLTVAGRPRSVLLGPLPPPGATAVLRAEVPAGSRLDALRLSGDGLRTGELLLAGELPPASRWRLVDRDRRAPADALAAAPTAAGPGLRWSFAAPDGGEPVLALPRVPVPLPGVAGAGTGAAVGDVVTGRGLDGAAVPVRVVATLPAVPRHGPGAVLVDLSRLQALAGRTGSVRSEVWLAAGAGDVAARLEAAGVRVDRQQSAADRERAFARQSPSLAVLLFLAGSAVAGVLAAGGAVLELHVLGRRRSYEVAALQAAGVRRGALVRAAVLEQLLLLGTGTAAGVGAGVLAARLVLPGVPEFVDRPVSPPLVVAPDAVVVASVVGAGVLAVALAVAASAVVLVRRARPDLLREAQA